MNTFDAAEALQERIKLEAWREEVRSLYAEAGPAIELPLEYPPQLQVGQKVVARHPVTRQLHDGDVLTVTANSYRSRSLEFFLSEGQLWAPEHRSIAESYEGRRSSINEGKASLHTYVI